LVITSLLPKLVQAHTAIFKVLTKMSAVSCLVERFSRTMIEGSSHYIFQIIPYHLLVVKSNAFGVLGFKLGRDTFTKRKEKRSTTKDGLIASSHPCVDIFNEFVCSAACIKFHF
jgi:hypothetical protein